MRNRKTNGANENSVSISANPKSNTFVSGKTHINRPIPVRNTLITI
jgi:hypothetical protein